MIPPQLQISQAPPKTKHAQPAVPETDPSKASELPDILTVIHDNLAFLDRIDHIISARSRAGYKGQRDTALHI